jgi:acylphosphatase
VKVIRHVVVRGRVQGVGYRAWTEHEAIRRGLKGWVRNRRDHTVEAVFSGPEPEIVGMIEALRGGPPGARVEALDQREGTAEDLAPMRPGDLFSVLPTV